MLYCKLNCYSTPSRSIINPTKMIRLLSLSYFWNRVKSPGRMSRAIFWLRTYYGKRCFLLYKRRPGIYLLNWTSTDTRPKLSIIRISLVYIVQLRVFHYGNLAPSILRVTISHKHFDVGMYMYSWQFDRLSRRIDIRILDTGQFMSAAVSSLIVWTSTHRAVRAALIW